MARRDPPKVVPTLTEVVRRPTAQAARVAAADSPMAQPAAVGSVEVAELDLDAVPATDPVMESEPDVQADHPRAVPAEPFDFAADRRVEAPAEQQPPAIQPESPAARADRLAREVSRRLDKDLDARLREAVASLVLEQSKLLIPQLRAELEDMVRRAVAEALQEEAAQRGPF